MTPRRSTATLVSALLLAAPAPALAQSAGDEQYADPLPSEPAAPNGDGGSPGRSGSGAAPSAPTQAAPAGPAPSAGSGAAGAAATPVRAAELPRTGGDAVLLALFGSALLALGVALRLALPRRA